MREQKDARGHAVRAMYLCSGIADVARETGDGELMAVAEELWKSVTGRQMYITGSLGSSPHGEAFSFDYDLPNDTIYGETCAAIGLVFFARRMLESFPDSRYADVMERALYNGVLSGMSLDGTQFFYVNPLEVWPEACERDFFKRHVKPERQKWFGCSCCPPNLARLVASLASYAAGAGDDGSLYTHLYLGGEFIHKTGRGDTAVSITTRYPWDGNVRVVFSPEGPLTFKYAFRVPAWCPEYRVKLNGKEIQASLEKGYAIISREWNKGDVLEIDFAMPVRVNEANPAVRENIGRAAVSRGPLVYCLEEADNGGNLHLAYLPEKLEFKTVFQEDLLGGVQTVVCEGKTLKNNWPEGELYREAAPVEYISKTLTWIPYYAWANRGAGEMRVWINRKQT